MNWFKKIAFKKTASVTFSIEGTYNVAQPMDLLTISSDLINFIFYVKKLKGLKITYDSIAPDTSSSDYSAPTGIINFYLSDPRLNIEFVKSLISDYNEYKDPFIALDVLREEKSGVSKYNVIRINVVKNETTDIEKLPELNVSNSNAIALLTLLSHYGTPVNIDDLSGSIDVNILENAINRIDNMDVDVLDDYTQESSQSTGENGARAIDFGRSKQQVERYLAGLRSIINYARKENLSNAQIQYA